MVDCLSAHAFTHRVGNRDAALACAMYVTVGVLAAQIARNGRSSVRLTAAVKDPMTHTLRFTCSTESIVLDNFLERRC